jgi:leucyl aminopeptidase
MKITVNKGHLPGLKCEAILGFHFEDGKKPSGMAAILDKLSGGLIAQVIASGDFEGKLNQIAVIYPSQPLPAKRIVLTGLGKKKDFNLEKARGVFAKAAQHIRSLNVKRFAASLEIGLPNQPPGPLAEAAVEGVMLGLYQFNPFKTIDRDKIKMVDEFIIAEENQDRLKVIRTAAKTAEIVSHAVCFARDMVSTPGNEMTPAVMAKKALEIALDKAVKCKVLDREAMEKLGMNALLGVAQGSGQPAKFIILEYGGGPKGGAPVVLVGKGLTFDSGGISLKPSEKMDEMKTDMSGGAAVIGALKAVAALKLPLNVVGLVPATENLPDGKAYKPGDVLKSLSGQTIEVLNTDAEGRLILADALTYAGRYKPAAIVDLATLTGACVIALGDHVIGMLGTSDRVKEDIRKAAESTGERVWELPLWEEYHEQIKSTVADYKNASGRAGGTITAAAFLSKFVGDYPWVHLDIAGPAWLSKDMPYIPQGASGVGVRLIIQFLRNRLRAK